MSKKIFLIAGEASGDLHGSRLIQSLQTHATCPLEIYGVGGDKIRQTGALEFFDLAHFHTTGFTEAVRHIHQYAEAKKRILNSLKKVSPDLVILIDNPGFNLILAKEIHRLGIPIVYYITPQLWAWAPKRIFKIKRTVKKVLVVFEFEKKIYEDQGIPVTWVGHPLKDFIEAAPKKKPSENRVISLLPGSRIGEIKTLFALFLKTARLISNAVPGTTFRVIQSPTLPRVLYEKILAELSAKSGNLTLSIVENDSYAAIGQSDLAIVCSGTATLECALLGTPMIICNRGSLITYLIAKCLILVPYIGLPNLILNEKKMPELLQFDATPEKISDAAIQILKNKSLQESMRNDLNEVSRRLGEKGASERAAKEILLSLRGA